MKMLILLLLVSFTLKAQQGNTSLTGINTTLSDSFAVIGENVKDLFIDPEIEGRLIATTGSYGPKIKISLDYGTTWNSAIINSSEFSKPHVMAYEISFNTTNYNIGYVAAGIDLYKTTDRGESWDSTGFSDLFPEYDLRNWGEIRNIEIHPYNPKIMFTSSGGVFSHVPILFRSTDGDETWSITENGKYRNFAFDYTDTNTIYGIEDFRFIAKSTDSGESWERINNNLVFSIGNIMSLAISKNNPDVLYCCQLKYMNDEDEQDPWRLSMTNNGGDSWERIDSTLLAIDQNGSVYDILLDQNEEGRFYISYTGGLYLTEDNGKHYQKIYSGEAGKIWSDNRTPAIIYFNSDKGLLRILDTLVVSVENGKTTIPQKIVLYQNYPNPFNPSTTVKYQIPKNERRKTINVRLTVYDVLGREVTTLVNERKPPGNYEVLFNVKNLSSGMYFYELRSGNFREVKKMLLLR